MNASTPHAPQIKIAATYMRGGTSKGVFSVCRICRKPHKLLALPVMRYYCE